jgi:hypothetical protein
MCWAGAPLAGSRYFYREGTVTAIFGEAQHILYRKPEKVALSDICTATVTQSATADRTIGVRESHRQTVSQFVLANAADTRFTTPADGRHK